MWRDIKMWLIIRYVYSRIYGKKSPNDIKENITTLDNDTGKVFLSKELLIHEVFKIKNRLWLMFFPVSWRRRFASVSFDGWKKIRSYTTGPITSIFETALKENFLEPYSGIISPVPTISGYGYNSKSEIEKIIDDKYIRVSEQGEGFKSVGGGFLFLTKKYYQAWILIWLIIAWLFLKFFKPLLCSFFPKFFMC